MRTIDFSLWRRTLRNLIRPDQLAKIQLRPGDVAIDCGANIGYVTQRMARRGVVVHAFEPNPYAYRLLAKRFAGNPHVHCYQKGVTDQDGTLKLYLHQLSAQEPVKWSTGSSLLAEKGNVNQNDFVEVEVIDLAHFIESLHAKVKVLKLDVEGVEYRIVDHLIETGVIHEIEHILIEAHAERMPSLQAEASRVLAKVASHNLTNIDWGWD
jgi:FkbM family methyltransferase